ncbi:MAG: HEAT repeat domain-containing protein, partial [Terriglobia bacterium]
GSTTSLGATFETRRQSVSVTLGLPLSFDTWTLAVPNAGLFEAHLSAFTAQPDEPPIAVSGTVFDVERASRIIQLVEQTVFSAVEEPFEDGAPSRLTESLASFLREFGNDACKAIDQTLESLAINDEVADEVFRFLGSVKHRATHKYRLNLLQRGLQSPSARIRYAAILGLASMNDPDTIPAVTGALQSESSERVRRAVHRLLEQLQNSERCRAS